MTSALSDLLGILDLERLEENLYRGLSLDAGWPRIYGGQVIAQALVAAARTVGPERQAHSLHGYFLLPGDRDVPVLYEVERIRDGRSFATRRVVAIQHGRAIFTMAASFHVEEEGAFAHHAPMPEVPPPEALPDEDEVRRSYLDRLGPWLRPHFARARPVEMRPVDFTRYLAPAPGEPAQAAWIRAAGALPDDPVLHRAVLAYASDMTMIDTILAGHGRTVFDRDLQLATLDHAMWFHRPFRIDDWLLYAQDSQAAHGARGLAHGAFFTRDGALVASAAQEGLIRRAADRG